jgi:hypothetical protein
MLILIPFKPVALVIGVLAALILAGYFLPLLIEGKNPYADDLANIRQIAAKYSAAHPAAQHKHASHAAQ